MNGVYKFHPNAKVPTKANVTDAGWDIYALRSTFLPCGKTTLVETGIAVEIHEGNYARICDRSSMAKRGLYVGGGVIDATYTGNIEVILTNLTCIQDQREVESGVYDYGYWINAGDRIAQLVFHKFEPINLVEVNALWSSVRGNKGLGSSGK